MSEERIVARVVFDTSGLKGIGAAAGPMGGGGGGGAAMLGGGLGKAGAIAGAVAAGVTEVIAQLKKVWNAIKESSPRLQATLSIMGKAFMMILRPIGDVIAMFLKPMAIYLLRFARNWYKEFGKWFGDLKAQKALKGPQVPDDIAKLGDNIKTAMVGPTKEAIDANQQVNETMSEGVKGMENFNQIVLAGVNIWGILRGILEGAWGVIKIVAAAVMIVGQGLAYLLNYALIPLQPVLEFLAQAWMSIGSFLNDFGSAMIALATGGSIDDFKTAVSEAWDALMENFGVALDNFWISTVAMIEGVLKALGIDIPQLWETIKTFFTETVPNWIISGWDALRKFFVETIPQWFQSMIDNIKAMVEKFTAPVAKAGKAVVTYVKQKLGISSGSGTGTPTAGGGIMAAMTPTLVGEKGPEIITSGRPATVTPNRGGQNVSFNININALDASSINSRLIDKLTTQIAYQMRYRLTRMTTESIGA
jgi:hypothetical protein